MAMTTRDQDGSGGGGAIARDSRGRSFRIFVSTGEVSGDLQGAMLVAALGRSAAAAGIDLEIVALGGPRMGAAGATVLADTSEIGSIGLWEALPYLLPTWRVQRVAKAYLRQNPPDLVILLDYLGPNLGIGGFLRRTFKDLPIWYYIAPQEWVWSLGDRNTNQIAGLVDRILSIFPQEAKYYEARGAAVTWVGHPLIDRLAAAPDRSAARRRLGMDVQELAIALVPASRPQELKYLMPVMFAAAQQIQAARPTVRFWIPLSIERFRPAVEAAIAEFGLRATVVGPEDLLNPGGDPQALEAQPSILCLAAADLAIAKSGTVNLETALLNVPQVVVYRVSAVTAWVAEHVLKFSIPFMSIANLVEMRQIVPEFLQDAATPEAIAAAALELLTPDARSQMLADYQQMRAALGDGGACDRAAQTILETLIARQK